MSRKSKSQYLLEKSIHAALSAIEVYNKPDFKYREESFCILMVNAWEVLLKARILQENKNKIQSIYIEDSSKQRKDGKPHKKTKYKTSRSGNFLTLDIINAIQVCKLDRRLSENLKLLVEIRDNAIHFYNESKVFEKKLLEIGTASLKSYVDCVNDWFDYDLSRYNFFLMPISFFHVHEIKSFSINKEEKQHKNLLQYIDSIEKAHPSDIKSKHNISLILETKFVRSQSLDGIPIRVDSNNPNAISVKIDSEERFGEMYPWSFKEDLVPKLKARYSNIKFDAQFRTLIRSLEKNKAFCGERFLDFKRKKGGQKKFYNPNIINEFDKHYTRKK
jgi:hypothetical protein